MPGGDRTGPWGQGPRSGRAAGYCAGYTAAGYMNPAIGRGFEWGFGRGRGGGRGHRHWFYATRLPAWMRWGPPVPSDPATEKQVLENEVSALQAELDQLRKRLAELGQPTTKP